VLIPGKPFQPSEMEHQIYGPICKLKRKLSDVKTAPGAYEDIFSEPTWGADGIPFHSKFQHFNGPHWEALEKGLMPFSYETAKAISPYVYRYKISHAVALPCPALPCPALPCPALPCPVQGQLY
jgi:hypothetical protein